MHLSVQLNRTALRMAKTPLAVLSAKGVIRIFAVCTHHVFTLRKLQTQNKTLKQHEQHHQKSLDILFLFASKSNIVALYKILEAISSVSD